MAIASAALGEVYSLSYSMDILSRHWPGSRATVELPTRILDQFVNHIDVFGPSTAHAVFDLRGSVRDVLTGLETLRSEDVQNPEKMKKEVQMLARVTVAKALCARRVLEREGGELPRGRYWPNTPAIEQHLSEVKEYLTDTTSEEEK